MANPPDKKLNDDVNAALDDLGKTLDDINKLTVPTTYYLTHEEVQKLIRIPNGDFVQSFNKALLSRFESTESKQYRASLQDKVRKIHQASNNVDRYNVASTVLAELKQVSGVNPDIHKQVIAELEKVIRMANERENKSEAKVEQKPKI